jgi:hypothetical protein
MAAAAGFHAASRTRPIPLTEELVAEGRTMSSAQAVAVGGAGLFRDMGLERLVRDIHAVQFHPLPANRQHRFTGRCALGLDPVG